MLARLNFRVPPDQADRFQTAYESTVTPLLTGWIASTRQWPAPPQTFSRTYTFDSRQSADSAFAAVESRASWASTMTELVPRFGIHKQMRYDFAVVHGPAGSGSTRPAGSGTRTRVDFGVGHWTTYDVTDGLSAAVYRGDALQDRDGHLWFATQGVEVGVVKYDGDSWQVNTSTDRPRSNRINALFEDSRGTIWVMTSDGIRVNTRGIWTRVDTPSALPAPWVGAAVEDREGRVWFGTWGGGVARFDPEGRDGSQWTSFTEADGLGDNVVRSAILDRDGRLWFGTNSGVTRYDPAGGPMSPETCRTYTVADGLSSNLVHAQAHQDKEGDLWFRTGDDVSRFDGERWIRYVNGLGHTRYSIVDADRVVWFATRNGLVKHDGVGTTVYTTDQGLPDNDLRDVALDRHGVLWIGTANGVCRMVGNRIVPVPEIGTGIARTVDVDQHGQVWVSVGSSIVRLDPYTITRLSDSAGPLRESVFDVLQSRSGDLWFAEKPGGLVKFDGRALSRYDDAEGFPSDEATCLAEDDRGVLWIGTFDQGLVQYDGRTFTRFGVEDGLSGSTVTHLLADEDGRLWIGTRSGLSIYDGETFSNYGPRDALGKRWIWGLDQSTDGDVWVGSEDGGLVRIRGDSVEHVQPPGATAETKFLSVAATSDGSVWFGTAGSGTFRRDHTGGWARFSTADGLAGDYVLDIEEDSKGIVWFATAGGGVGRYDGESFQTLTTKDGLAGNFVEAVAEDRDGAVWFVGPSGMTRYVFSVGEPPSVRFTEVLADRRYAEPTALDFDTTVDLVSIGFRGLSLKTRRDGLVYQYRLLGLEERWETTRSGHVSYADLPAGDYRFQVEAVDRDHVYSAPATLSVTVHPPYTLGLLVAGLVLAVAVGAGQTVRVVRRDRELKRTQAQLIDEMGKELEAARSMQMGLLPKDTPNIEGIEFAALCEPARQVGGDYYTYVESDEGSVALVVADVSGKGMQAATIAMRFNEMLKYEFERHPRPVDVLDGLDRALRGRIPPEMFATCGIAQFDGRRVTIASGACPEVYHYRAQEESATTLELSGLPIGLPLVIEGQDLFNETVVELEPGDLLVFTSDGVEEAFNPEDEMYGGERLGELLTRCGQKGMTAEGVRDEIVRDVTVFAEGRDQSDDLTVVVVRRQGQMSNVK